MPARGRVDDDEVVRLGAGRAALVLGELPQLPDGQQLAHARRRGGEVAEDPALLEHLGERPGELVGIDFVGEQYETHIMLADVRLERPPQGIPSGCHPWR